MYFYNKNIWMSIAPVRLKKLGSKNFFCFAHDFVTVVPGTCKV